MTSYLVAIDGGGTKTDYLLSDLNGQVIKQLSHSPTSLTTNGIGIAAFNLREGMRLLFEGIPTGEIAVLVIAVAGLDTREENDQAHTIFSEVLNTFPFGQLKLINDSMAALANGSQAKQAIILIGGTGSNCLGYNQSQIKKVSGLDYVLTDEGSGYDAGRLALRAAVRSFDGRGPKSLLEGLVFDHFQVKKASQLKAKVYNPVLTKAEMASLAQECHQAMKAGDSVATAIINYCLDELLLNVQTVAQQLALADQAFDLVIAGSFITNLSDLFHQKLSLKLPQARLIVPEQLPVFGALKIAQQIHAGQDCRQYDLPNFC